MSKSQAWRQPSDPAPAEDLNLNPDTKFGVQGLRGFLWAHPKLKPSTKISPAGAGCLESSVPSPLPQLSHPSMQWLQIHSACTETSDSLELCRGGFSSHSAVLWGSLFSWHLVLPCPGCLGFREQGAGFRSCYYNLTFKNYYYYYFQGNRDSRSYLLCDFSHPEVLT